MSTKMESKRSRIAPSRVRLESREDMIQMLRRHGLSEAEIQQVTNFAFVRSGSLTDKGSVTKLNFEKK